MLSIFGTSLYSLTENEIIDAEPKLQVYQFINTIKWFELLPYQDTMDDPFYLQIAIWSLIKRCKTGPILNFLFVLQMK